MIGNLFIHNNYEIRLDIVRFFAAFSVMTAHLEYNNYGFWGVDFFFVLSGLVIMLSTEISQKTFFSKD